MNKQWMYVGFVSMALGAVVWAGCGDDSGSSDSTSSSSASVASSSASGSGGGGTCDFTPVNDCQQCVADKCVPETAACCAKVGCIDVVLCAQEKMCAGLDCYTADNCMAEIDKAGLDVAQGEATVLGECANKVCNVECGLPGEGGAGGTGGAGGAGGM